LSGRHRIVESIDLFTGGNDTLIGGAGADIMIGGVGEEAFHGSTGEDLMIGGYAYIELEGDQLQAMACCWFGNDPFANPLGEPTDAGSSSANGEGLMLAFADRWGLGTAGLSSQGGMSTFNPEAWASNDIQGQQRDESSHPGSYDGESQLSATKGDGEPEGREIESGPAPQGQADDQAVLPVTERRRSWTPSALTAEKDEAWPSPLTPTAGPRTPEKAMVDRRHTTISDRTDFSLAIAGLAGWRAAAPDEEQGPPGLLDRAGFKRLKNREDGKRFRSFLGR
jgi:hypothetical protein